MRTASSKGSAPAATSAVYSPRLWPATQTGSGRPSSSSARRSATLTVRIAGCWISVRRSSSSPEGSKQMRESGRPSTASARSKISRAAGEARAASRPMPTSWEPCPGKSSASKRLTPLGCESPRDRDRSRSSRRPGAGPWDRRSAGRRSAAAWRARRASAACPASSARCDPWEPPSAPSSTRPFAQRPERRKGRAARPFRAATGPRVAVRTAARAEPRAFLPAKRLDRKCEADDLVDESGEVDLAAPVPARSELLRQTHTVARQGVGPLGVRGFSEAGGLEHQAEGLLERLTIAREAAAAFEGETATDLSLDQEVVAHPVGGDAHLEGLFELRRQVPVRGDLRAPPRRPGFEVEGLRRRRESVDGDLHGWTGAGPVGGESLEKTGACLRVGNSRTAPAR